MLFWFTLAIDQFPTSAFLFPLSLSISPCSETNNGPLVSRSQLIISHTLAIVLDHLNVSRSDQPIQVIIKPSYFPPLQCPPPENFPNFRPFSKKTSESPKQSYIDSSVCKKPPKPLILAQNFSFL